VALLITSEKRNAGSVVINSNFLEVIAMDFAYIFLKAYLVFMTINLLIGTGIYLKKRQTFEWIASLILGIITMMLLLLT